MVNKKQIMQAIKKIPDPELGISVVDLGLIYDVEVTKKGEVKILMTLTSIGCPLFNLISDPIKAEVSRLPGVKSVFIDLTFEPPWNMDRMSKSARAALGMF